MKVSKESLQQSKDTIAQIAQAHESRRGTPRSVRDAHSARAMEAQFDELLASIPDGEDGLDLSTWPETGE